MLQSSPSTPDEADAWSPRWRSIHPVLTDYEILDALKAELERRFAAEGKPHAIARLEINRQLIPCFRLPNGVLLHWAQLTKAASTSVTAVLCKNLPYIWRGPRKSWNLPYGQQAAPTRDIFHNTRLFPARVLVTKASRRRRAMGALPRLRMPSSIPAKWAAIRCNPRTPEKMPNKGRGIRNNQGMFVWRDFRPEPGAKIRFCIVREPVDRFMSAIASMLRSDRAGQGADPLAYLEKTLKKMEETQRPRDEHFSHQIGTIGCNPSYYTHIFRMGEWERLETCLSEWIGTQVKLPHKNASRGKEKISLTPALRQRVEAWYAKDYKFWGRYF